MTTNQALQSELKEPIGNVNLSIGERWLSMIGGGALAALAFRQRGVLGVILGLLGWYMTERGLTGHCRVYERLGFNTAVKTNKHAVSVPHEQGVHIVKSIIVNRSPDELYSFWRNFENLPRIMKHLESVQVIDHNRSHWVAKGPVGTTIEWDAEIVNEVPKEAIGWRSLDNAQIANAGSVRFKALPGGQSTAVQVTMEYVPPAGAVGMAVAKLLGEEPEIQIEDDLRRFKQLAETGQITAGWQGVSADQGGGAEDNGGKKRRKKDQDSDDMTYPAPADQAEGERGGAESSKVGKTPGQAEG